MYVRIQKECSVEWIEASKVVFEFIKNNFVIVSIVTDAIKDNKIEVCFPEELIGMKGFNEMGIYAMKQLAGNKRPVFNNFSKNELEKELKGYCYEWLQDKRFENKGE